MNTPAEDRSGSVPDTAVTADSAMMAIGRYIVFEQIAAGGMATVHLGRLLGSGGFARTVAIKRMRATLASDAEFVTMFLNEAKLASRIRHPNVVTTLDVLSEGGEVLLVMEYASGQTLDQLFKKLHAEGKRIPLPILVRLLTDALAGLHASHEATDEDGTSLNVIHRDVTPHNIIVDTGGVARVLDFGIAKAANGTQQTQEGAVKGKPAYMAQEQFGGTTMDRRVDVYAIGAVLWEGLAGRQLYTSKNIAEVLFNIFHHAAPRVSTLCADVLPALDDAIDKALSRDPEQRYETAEVFAEALERAVAPATQRAVAEWLQSVAGHEIREASARVRRIEQIPMARLTELAGSGLVPMAPGNGSGSQNRSFGGSGTGSGAGRRDTRTSGDVAVEGGDTSLQATSTPTLHASKRKPLALGLVVIGAVFVAFFALRRGAHVEQPPVSVAMSNSMAAPLAAPPSSRPEPAVPSPRPVASTSEEPVASASPASPRPRVGSSAPSRRGSAAVSAKPPAPAASSSAPAAPAAPVAPAKNDCAVPYSVDENGIKRIKAECR